MGRTPSSRGSRCNDSQGIPSTHQKPDRVAHGTQKRSEMSKERVVVVTGGASGLEGEDVEGVDRCSLSEPP
jgi:hypothetical protein